MFKKHRDSTELIELNNKAASELKLKSREHLQHLFWNPERTKVLTDFFS